MLIRRARLFDGRVADIRVSDVISDVAPGLTPQPGEHVLDAKLGAVLPGLHDHHLHVRAAAAALGSITVDRQFASAVAAAHPGAEGWIRAIGYHESVTGELDRARLDAMRPHTPLRVQHRSGALWVLNSAALASIGYPHHPDGRIRSTDRRLGAIPRRDTDLAELSRRLAGYGVTGVTDATPGLCSDDIDALTSGLVQRVRCLAPGKRILHDDELDLDELTRWICACHAAGEPVALHCVTTAQLVVALAALRTSGTHALDRIEHAAMVPDDTIGDLAASRVTVVTQPNFVAERGEQYRADIGANELGQLWRIKSLFDAGIRVAASTDAPFGDLDPWAAMRAATARSIGPPEQVEPAVALRMFLGFADRPAEPRRLEPGHPGDVCVLAAPPDEALRALASDMVVAAVVGGNLLPSG